MADPLEVADSIQPGNAGFKLDDAKVVAPYFVDSGEVQEQILSTVGTNQEGDDGRVRRSLPKAHSQYPFLVASSINVVGHGKPTPTASEASDEAQPPAIALQYGLYDEYVGTVEFLQHPWDFLPDEDVGLVTSLCYDEDGNECVFTYAEEFGRYCEIDEQHDAKIISATQGMLAFFTENPASTIYGDGFAGTPRIPYPETTLTVLWHQVPYRYLSSPRSFLKRYAMRVNQQFMSFGGYEFEPGQLLYLGMGKYRRYQPPFPVPNTDPRVSSRFMLEKWVDVPLIFSAVNRVAPDAPDLPNPSWIPAGHNLMPHFSDRKFHYVASFRGTTAADGKNDRNFWQPIFDSAPLHVLWTDPDAITPNPAPL